MDADAVVTNGEDPESIVTFGPDMYGRRPFIASVLDRIAHQVLKELPQMGAVGAHRGELIAGNYGAAFRYCSAQIG